MFGHCRKGKALTVLRQQLVFGKRVIPYDLRFSQRRRLRIDVYPDGRVSAVAPSFATPDEVAVAIRTKVRWVVRQVDFFEQFHPLPEPKRYVSGETFRYLGRQYVLKIEKGQESSVKLKGKYLRVQTRSPENVVATRLLVEGWYRKRAEIVFSADITRFLGLPHLQNLKSPPTQIRKMKTRWGSCTPNGKVILNLMLVATPKSCIEYVIVHELCHLKVHNHSAAFYHLLGKCMPDWQARKSRLNHEPFQS